MRRLVSILIVTGAVLAVVLVGFAGAANANATVDLIWIDVSNVDTNGNPICLRPAKRNCPQLGTTISSVAVSDNITLAVIITAGSRVGVAGVSVDYSDALPKLSVNGFRSLLTPPYLPLGFGVTSDVPPYIDNIIARVDSALNIGIGLPPGATAYLGTVSFHKDLVVNRSIEVAVGTDGPNGWDGIWGVGLQFLTPTTTFNSAFITTPEPSALPALGSGIAILALLYRRHRHSMEP